MGKSRALTCVQDTNHIIIACLFFSPNHDRITGICPASRFHFLHQSVQRHFLFIQPVCTGLFYGNKTAAFMYHLGTLRIGKLYRNRSDLHHIHGADNKECKQQKYEVNHLLYGFNKKGITEAGRYLFFQQSCLSILISLYYDNPIYIQPIYFSFISYLPLLFP